MPIVTSKSTRKKGIALRRIEVRASYISSLIYGNALSVHLLPGAEGAVITETQGTTKYIGAIEDASELAIETRQAVPQFPGELNLSDLLLDYSEDKGVVGY